MDKNETKSMNAYKAKSTLLKKKKKKTNKTEMISL